MSNQNGKQMVHRGIGYNIIMSGWVLITTPPSLVNHNPAISSVSQGTENLEKSPQVDKNPW